MINDRIDFSGRSAIITGTTSGMGKIASPEMARHDDDVVCCCVAPGVGLTRPSMAQMQTPIGRAAEPE